MTATPTKSESDDRSYKIFSLENTLQVLVVCDPNTDKGAAAMAVGVGFHNDPDNIPGLAHLLEHMLFQGTEKYPDSNSFSTYLSEHAGKSNAHTGGEETAYYFDVMQSHLRGALDIWSQFFISPLFNQEKTELELSAVDSENSKNLQSDSWRFNQLLRMRCDPTHPYSHFGTGNYKVLSSAPNLRSILLDFHAKYYSANIMKLVILGRESLDELESWAREIFEPIKNSNASRDLPPPNAFTPVQLQKILLTVPVREVSQLSLIWPLPPLQPLYRQKPASYISHLIGHEGEGSILSLLKNRGWVAELVAGPYQPSQSFSLFKVDMELTEQGLEKIHEIVQVIFQYIQLVKDEGVLERIYSETKVLQDIQFRFKNKSEPFDYTQSLASNMFQYSPKDVLIGPYLHDDFDPKLIQHMLSHLSVSNLRIHIASKIHVGVIDSVEPYYETPFIESDIPDNLTQLCVAPGKSVELAIPGKNPFIPADLSLRSCADSDSTLSVILSTAFARIMHKQDVTFRRPKAHVSLELVAPVCYHTPRCTVMTRLWTNVLEDSLNEYSYEATLAGLEFTLVNTTSGCQLLIKGYNDKIGVLAERVFHKIAHLTVDNERFFLLREKLSREYKNMNKDDQYKRVLYNTSQCIEQSRWHNDDYINVVDDITPTEWHQFTSTMFSHVFVEGLILGNITKQESLKIVSTMESIMSPKALLRSQMPEQRIIVIPEGNYLHSSPGPNKDNLNSAIQNVYQIGMENAKDGVVLDLLSQILQDPAYQQLRNIEQLGYIVWALPMRHYGVMGYRIIIQSRAYPPPHLDARIDQFLLATRELLAGLSAEEWSNYVDALIAEKEEKDKTLAQETARYWKEITARTFVFDRVEREVAALKAVTQNDLLAFYDKHISPSSKHRRKLSVHVWGAAHEIKEGNHGTPKDSKLEGVTVDIHPINDCVSFKKSAYLYPIPTPGAY